MVILFLIPYGKAVYPASQNSSNSADNTYKVRVSIPDLNIRTGAGTEYPATGEYTGKGVFTIVETKNGWGQAAGNQLTLAG